MKIYIDLEESTSKAKHHRRRPRQTHQTGKTNIEKHDEAIQASLDVQACEDHLHKLQLTNHHRVNEEEIQKAAQKLESLKHHRQGL